MGPDGQRIELPEWALLPNIGLYMDQVITLTERALGGVLPEGEITRSMVNNYVKSGLLRRPTRKKYDRAHLAALLEIAVLKQSLSMEEIAQMLGLLGGGEEGYTLFCAQVRALEEEMAAGHVELGVAQGTQEERALRAGIASAVCAVSARRRLAALREK